MAELTMPQPEPIKKQKPLTQSEKILKQLRDAGPKGVPNYELDRILADLVNRIEWSVVIPGAISIDRHMQSVSVEASKIAIERLIKSKVLEESNHAQAYMTEQRAKDYRDNRNLRLNT